MDLNPNLCDSDPELFLPQHTMSLSAADSLGAPELAGSHLLLLEGNDSSFSLPE